jgi:hypothetical protein
MINKYESGSLTNIVKHLSIQSWLFAWSLLAIDIDILHMTTLGVLFSTDQSAKNLSNREVFKTEQTLRALARLVKTFIYFPYDGKQ